MGGGEAERQGEMQRYLNANYLFLSFSSFLFPSLSPSLFLSLSLSVFAVAVLKYQANLPVKLAILTSNS
jgi:hypothetical protein